MPTFQRCDNSVNELAAEILTEFESHKPILDARVKIDFVFAFPDYDAKTGEPLNDALKHHGCKALGVAKVIALKERALGRGDCEVSIDGDWWRNASNGERRALLDHELHHFEVKTERNGRFKFDDLNRPQLKLRPHDFEFGWFKIIAERHGFESQERIQAKQMMDYAGQFFWPEIAGK